MVLPRPPPSTTLYAALAPDGGLHSAAWWVTRERLPTERVTRGTRLSAPITQVLTAPRRGWPREGFGVTARTHRSRGRARMARDGRCATCDAAMGASRPRREFACGARAVLAEGGASRAIGAESGPRVPLQVWLGGGWRWRGGMQAYVRLSDRKHRCPLWVGVSYHHMTRSRGRVKQLPPTSGGGGGKAPVLARGARWE